jgi:type IV pilus assembly protein PilZ
VEYTRLNGFFADYTRNISKGGTFIKTRRPLPVGTEFVFKLVVPHMTEPMALRGQVMWVRREGEHTPPPPAAPGQEIDDDGNEPGMGIRFIYADDKERARIESVVERLMKDSLGPLLFAKLTRDRQGGR